MRLAIGASRRRLVTQLLTESLLLGAMGAVVSLVVAALTLQTLESLLPTDTASILRFTLQPRALIFTAALALLTGIFFGLFPALHSTRSAVMDAVRTSTVRIAGHRGARRFRTALVTSQITLACGLLICAGLFLKSLVNVFHADLGFRVDNTVTFTISPGRAGYDANRTALLFQQVEDELAHQPGVTGVATSAAPMGSPGWPELACCTASAERKRIVLIAFSCNSVEPVILNSSILRLNPPNLYILPH